MDRMNLRQWIENFNKDMYNKPDFKTQCEAGWYDWFCRDSSLRNKTYKMGNIVKQIKDGGKVNLDTMYVWFKNNCPFNGSLYDDFRFADLETGDVQFTTTINDFRNKKRYTVYGRRNNFDTDNPLFETDSSRELVKWFNTAWED